MMDWIRGLSDGQLFFFLLVWSVTTRISGDICWAIVSHVSVNWR